MEKLISYLFLILFTNNLSGQNFLNIGLAQNYNLIKSNVFGENNLKLKNNFNIKTQFNLGISKHKGVHDFKLNFGITENEVSYINSNIDTNLGPSSHTTLKQTSGVKTLNLIYGLNAFVFNETTQLEFIFGFGATYSTLNVKRIDQFTYQYFNTDFITFKYDIKPYNLFNNGRDNIIKGHVVFGINLKVKAYALNYMNLSIQYINPFRTNFQDLIINREGYNNGQLYKLNSWYTTTSISTFQLNLSYSISSKKLRNNKKIL